MTSTIISLWPLLHPLSHPTITLDVLPHKPFLGSKDGLLTDTAQVCNCSVSCLSSAPPLFPNHPHRHPFLPHLLSDLELFPGCVKVCFQIHLFSLLTTTPANRPRQCLTSTRPDPDSNQLLMQITQCNHGTQRHLKCMGRLYLKARLS